MEGLPNAGPRQVVSPPTAGSDIDRCWQTGRHICDRPLAAAARSQFADLGKVRVEGVRMSAESPAGRPKALPRRAAPSCADRALSELDPVLLWRTPTSANC